MTDRRRREREEKNGLKVMLRLSFLCLSVPLAPPGDPVGLVAGFNRSMAGSIDRNGRCSIFVFAAQNHVCSITHLLAKI